MLLFPPPSPPPVSYSREIAPIFALRCNGCHGDGGGLSTRTYADLMRGGNLGKVIVAGNPERSLLIHFLEGRRGEAHRMPLESTPLSADQIRTARRWIAEGAKKDNLAMPKRVLVLRPVRFGVGKPVRIFCRVRAESYLTLVVRDPRNRRPLFEEVASLRNPKERGDTARPGDLIYWDVSAGSGWPRSASVELVIQYAATEPKHTEFYAATLKGR